jgi:hypothetical protein
MLGDAHDLAEVLAWAKKRFWTEMKDTDGDDSLLEWPFPQAVRLEVAESLVVLCRCFDRAELSHRKENNLTGNKGEVKVRSLCEFRHWLTPVSVENLRRV